MAESVRKEMQVLTLTPMYDTEDFQEWIVREIRKEMARLRIIDAATADPAPEQLIHGG